MTPEAFQERLLAAQELAERVRSTGQRLTILSSGHVRLFHSTSEANAQSIRECGQFRGNTWFSASKTATMEHAKPKHGRVATLDIAVDAREIEFSTGTGEFYAPEGLTRNDAGIWSPEVAAPVYDDAEGASQLDDSRPRP